MAAASATSVDNNPRPWWITLINGLAAIIISGILLFADKSVRAQTYLILVNVVGIYFIISGIMDLVSMFIDHSAWGWKLVMGLIGISAGMYVLSYPLAAAVALPRVAVLILGISGIINGLGGLILAFKGGGWAMGLLSGMLLIFGIILVGTWNDLGSGLTFLWVAAVMGFIGGIMAVFRAFQQRSA